MDDRTRDLLAGIEIELSRIFKLVEGLGREAVLDDESIGTILETQDREALEIVSDTAGEVVGKVQEIIVEVRLAIQEYRKDRL